MLTEASRKETKVPRQVLEELDALRKGRHDAARELKEMKENRDALLNTVQNSDKKLAMSIQKAREDAGRKSAEVDRKRSDVAAAAAAKVQEDLDRQFKELKEQVLERKKAEAAIIKLKQENERQQVNTT